jgi:hypothetical protein
VQNGEMTMSEVLRDPVIRQMLRADRVSLSEFAKLLEKTARARNAVSGEQGAIALIEGLSAGSEMGY